MELGENFMLKASFLLHVQLKELSLFRSQARMDVKFEWAGRELLHPAHGRTQRWTIETCGVIRPQIFFRWTNVELLQAAYHRSKRQGLRQFSPAIIRRALAIRFRSIQ